MIYKKKWTRGKITSSLLSS